jgi:hypothetical protein
MSYKSKLASAIRILKTFLKFHFLKAQAKNSDNLGKISQIYEGKYRRFCLHTERKRHECRRGTI